MEFLDYLIAKKLVTRSELIKLATSQFYGSVHLQPVDGDGFQTLSTSTGEPLWTSLRRPPSGDVLSAHTDLASAAFRRAKVNSLAELVEQWHRDLIREMECLGQYATSIRCAKNLFVNRVEKKIVSRYVVTSGRTNTASSMIRNGDKIAVFEGSTTLFVVFAAASYLHNCTVVSSNGLLNSEYLHNPCLAKSFANFHMIGGRADYNIDRHIPEHAGVYGQDAQGQFEKDMLEDPGVTVLIVPCSGILPTSGPFATGGEVQGLKLSVIRQALYQKTPIRDLIFVADYSKMLPSKEQSYGIPIFGRAEWSKLLKEHGGRISLVTTPPPALRKGILERDERVHPCNRRDLVKLYPGIEFGPMDREYAHVAAEFSPLLTQTDAEFHEALELTPTAQEVAVADVA